jgi:two-component system chemotaxis response regulator CheY
MHTGVVLVVDDDEDVRETLGDIVVFCGRKAVKAEHGGAALKALQSLRPCLILLDLVMPVMDGWQFLDEIKKDAALAGIPIVVVSAHASTHSPTGVAAILKKPVELREIRAVVDQHC